MTGTHCIHCVIYKHTRAWNERIMAWAIPDFVIDMGTMLLLHEHNALCDVDLSWYVVCCVLFSKQNQAVVN